MSLGSLRCPCPVEKPPLNNLFKSICIQVVVPMASKSISWIWISPLSWASANFFFIKYVSVNTLDIVLPNCNIVPIAELPSILAFSLLLSSSFADLSPSPSILFCSLAWILSSLKAIRAAALLWRYSENDSYTSI